MLLSISKPAYILGGSALVAAIGAFYYWRKRSAPIAPLSVPEISKFPSVFYRAAFGSVPALPPSPNFAVIPSGSVKDVGCGCGGVK
jgi:hypothetical protein